MESIVVAVESSTVSVGGGRPVAVRKGEAWAADSDVVKAAPGLFSTDPARARGRVTAPAGPASVEQSTRRPGERSSARRAG